MGSDSSCIFCQLSHRDTSVEHIIPRTLGNLHYILPKGVVCAKCNNKFGLIENRVLSSQLFLDERRRLGLISNDHFISGHDLRNVDLVNFLLKVGYESLYSSRRKVWTKYDFTELLEHLMTGKSNTLFYQKPLLKGKHLKHIPGWIDRFRLQNNRLSLKYVESGECLYFQFQFGMLVSAVQLT